MREIIIITELDNLKLTILEKLYRAETIGSKTCAY